MEVKPGYKQTEVNIVPADWNLRQLGAAVVFLDGKRKPVKDTDRAKMRGSTPYYGASGIVDYISQYLFDEDLILLGEDGENILSRNCRLAFRISGKAWVNNHAHVLKPNSDVSIGFLTDYLESLNYERFNSGTAQPKLNKQTCFGIMLALPPTKAEQDAIAGALSDADAFIESLEQLLAKKRCVKQGAMQELLTGKKRLPGFSGNWQTEPLGECGEVTMGQSPPGATYNRTGIGSPLINGPTEFTDLHPIKVQWTTQPVRFCKTGDLLICVRGSSTGRTNYADDTYSIGRGVAAIRAKDHNDTEYLSYQVISGVSAILAAATGATFPSVDGASFRKLAIPLPSPAEQRVISAVLSDMIAEITAVEDKLAKARKIKQGMMKELLTGRIRLI